MRPPILDVTDLAVRRGTKALLHDITWRIQAGEHWVVLGPNGCGKTSLLLALTGYLTISAGEMKVLGQTYGDCDWRDLRACLGVVSVALHASIPPGETALDTVISGKYAQLDLWAPTTRADARAARAWLKFLECEEIKDRPWMYLSQGERQRVLIARALMAKPRLLILDEPCTGLDPIARAFFLRVMERLAKRREGPSLVLVTHHVEEITPSFSHALLLREGAVVAQGPLPRVLRSEPMGKAFGERVKIRRRQGTWQLNVQTDGRGR